MVNRPARVDRRPSGRGVHAAPTSHARLTSPDVAPMRPVRPDARPGRPWHGPDRPVPPHTRRRGGVHHVGTGPVLSPVDADRAINAAVVLPVPVLPGLQPWHAVNGGIVAPAASACDPRRQGAPLRCGRLSALTPAPRTLPRAALVRRCRITAPPHANRASGIMVDARPIEQAIRSGTKTTARQDGPVRACRGHADRISETTLARLLDSWSMWRAAAS